MGSRHRGLRAGPLKARARGFGGKVAHCNVFVGSLMEGATEATLQSAFAGYGHIKSPPLRCTPPTVVSTRAPAVACSRSRSLQL